MEQKGKLLHRKSLRLQTFRERKSQYFTRGVVDPLAKKLRQFSVQLQQSLILNEWLYFVIFEVLLINWDAGAKIEQTHFELLKALLKISSRFQNQGAFRWDSRSRQRYQDGHPKRDHEKSQRTHIVQPESKKLSLLLIQTRWRLHRKYTNEQRCHLHYQGSTSWIGWKR